MLHLKAVERGFPEMQEEEAGLCLPSRLEQQHRPCGLKGLVRSPFRAAEYTHKPMRKKGKSYTAKNQLNTKEDREWWTKTY